MRKIRLRTKFLLSLLAITAGLSSATLLIVSYSVQKRVRENIREDLRSSVDIYQSFERQREGMLQRSAQLLADLPNVRAMMTTQDSATIQDASADVWSLSGSDLMVFADRSGDVVAMRAKNTSFERPARHKNSCRHPWRRKNRATGGTAADTSTRCGFNRFILARNRRDSALGYLAVGHEIDERAAKDFSKIASSDVAFRWGDTFVASTLSPAQQTELGRSRSAMPTGRRKRKSERTISGDDRGPATRHATARDV